MCQKIEKQKIENNCRKREKNAAENSTEIVEHTARKSNGQFLWA